MQGVAAPIAGRKQRHRQARDVGYAAAIVLIDEFFARDQRVDVRPRRLKLRIARFAPAYGLAGHPAAWTALAKPVLHPQHLSRIPVAQEVTKNAAMARTFAVVIGETFPGADGGEMRRPGGPCEPAIGRVIGDPAGADLAVAPALRAGPFNAGRDIGAFSRGKNVQKSFRLPGAA